MAPNAKPNCEEKVVFRDLEPLLRQSLGCEQLQVIEFTATKLVPPGENYNSILVKIDATIRRSKDARDEQLHLAAKTMYKLEKPILDWPLVLKKEIFVYLNLIPAYRDLERETGMKDNELIDILPKYIGHRYSLCENSEDVDEDSVLLMENLKARGYYNCNKRTGLDVHHARKALSALARYHALGITLKQKRPDCFKKVLAQARVSSVNDKSWILPLDAAFKDLTEDPSIVGDHLPVIKASFERFKSIGMQITTSDDDIWGTIIHGDFLINNIMFHKDEQGDVDDVKFIDFQLYLFHSALKDLPVFIVHCLSDDAIDYHLDELLNVYYETFVKTLERMGIDKNIYSRESFDNELKKLALDNFPICMIVAKFIMFEVNEEHKNDELHMTVFESKCNEVVKNKLRRLVRIYEERSWF